MAASEFENIKICGIACAVPQKKVDNREYDTLFGKNVVDKFMRIIGVKERHVSAPKQTAGDLCYVAAKNLLRRLQWEHSSVDVLLFVTQTPDYRAPATACVLHKRLGLAHHCIAFDITLGCSGYLYGLFTAASFLQTQGVKRALVLIGENCNPQDENPATAMLFGDAGSATALENGKDVMRFLLKTDGTRYDKIIAPYGGARNKGCREVSKKSYSGMNCSDYAIMDGPAVFDFTLFDLPQAFEEFFHLFGTSMDAFDYCILHQSNFMAMKELAKKIQLPLEKMPITIDRFGNTGGCSTPLTVAFLCESLQAGRPLRLIFMGYGIGFSWGVMECSLNSNAALPIIYTDDYYKEAF